MNIMEQNGNKIIAGEGKVIINGVSYDLPKGCCANNITQINNKLYIDGYEFKNGKFKRTIKAFIYKIF